MFDLVAASLWKCRTMVLASDADADAEARLVSVVSARGGDVRLLLRVPDGYYGNAIAMPVAISKAGELCSRPVGYAVELVRNAKAQVNNNGEEYIRSVADLMVLHGRPAVQLERLAYAVSDITWAGLRDLDYGWGRPVYAHAAAGTVMEAKLSFLEPLRNAKGEHGVVVLVCLPGPAMDTFVEEMGKLVRATVDVAIGQQHGVFLAKMSAL